MKYKMIFIDKKYYLEKKYNTICIVFSDDDNYFETSVVLSEDTARFIIRNIDSATKEYDYIVHDNAPDPVCINYFHDPDEVMIEFMNDSTTVKFTKEAAIQFQTDIMKLLSGYTTKISRIE